MFDKEGFMRTSTNKAGLNNVLKVEMSSRTVKPDAAFPVGSAINALPCPFARARHRQ